MLVIKVELHSAITGHVTEIARTVIYNSGGTHAHRDYVAISLRGRSAAQLEKAMDARPLRPVHEAKVHNHPRLKEHVWNLVAKSLTAMGYGANQEHVD